MDDKVRGIERFAVGDKARKPPTTGEKIGILIESDAADVKKMLEECDVVLVKGVYRPERVELSSDG